MDKNSEDTFTMDELMNLATMHPAAYMFHFCSSVSTDGWDISDFITAFAQDLMEQAYQNGYKDGVEVCR